MDTKLPTEPVAKTERDWICPYCGKPTAPLNWHERGDCPERDADEEHLADNLE